MLTRVLFILVSALAVALIAIAVTQSVTTLRDIPIQSQDLPDLDTSYLPPEVVSVAESEGEITLDGRSEPNASVVILDGETRIRSILADEQGEWTVTFPVEPTQQLEVSAQSYLEDIVLDGDQTVLRVPAPGAEDGISQRALILLTAPGGPSRVIQTPFGAPARVGDLALSMIEYDSSGGTILAGSAETGGVVRLMSGESGLGVGPVASDGRWFMILVEPDPRKRRDYTLVLEKEDETMDSLSVSFLPMEGQDIERSPELWQVKRSLSGGGHQVTAVFASPVLETDGESDADGS